ncbi:hypothetical protein U0L13_003347 [Providencia stuartii]|uniref:Uncharacterized protein n=1 Tax=Providencia stuartii TaxID=588 RepID=A0AAI9MWT9_PROST|nr:MULTISPECIES: hypothetical protein [Providencia]ELR5037133.1 hypothetical protein [Providencia stuartii]ELZ5941086.1 hypothetical protein [Providencia stuartii]MCK1143271.1 hypothetical protein [Providencia stuartii]
MQVPVQGIYFTVRMEYPNGNIAIGTSTDMRLSPYCGIASLLIKSKGEGASPSPFD